MIKGKIAYMSPEQASGHPIDHRSDIFSTGIILYELVTGKRMFTGADTLQILAKVSRAEFEPPEDVCTSLSPKICRILNKALTKDPDQRYPSCGEMLTDIEECLYELSLRPSARGLSQYTKELFHDEIAAEGQILRDSRPLEAGPPLSPEKEAKAAQEVGERAAAAPSAKAPSASGRRPLLFGAAGAVILILILAAVFAFRGKSGPPPAKEAPVKPAQASGGGPPERAAPAQPPPAAATVTEKVPSSREEAKALRDQAGALIEKDAGEARSILLKSVELDPASVQGHFQLGLAYMRLKEYGKAIEAYQKAAALDPKLPDTFFNLGYLYAVGKDYAKAEEMYGRTVSLAPSYLDEALFNLGMVQEKLGKRKESIESLEKALSINPKNETAKKLLNRLKQKS
jgi:tetratricopeptide (TPR) repeat protein